MHYQILLFFKPLLVKRVANLIPDIYIFFTVLCVMLKNQNMLNIYYDHEYRNMK